MRHPWLLALLFGGLVAPAEAGLLFGRKKEKPDPKTRVPELITTLKADKDGDKRARAAEELRQFDHAAFPEIIPALINALQSDARTGVRVEAAQSLGRVRPVSQVVGDALEQALGRDSSMRVRLQARSQLLQYQLAGYRSGKKTDVPTVTSAREPPLAQPDRYPPPVVTTPGGVTKEPPRSSRPALRPVPAQPPGSGSSSLTPPVPATTQPPLAPPPAPGTPPASIAPTQATGGEGPDLP